MVKSTVGIIQFYTMVLSSMKPVTFRSNLQSHPVKLQRIFTCMKSNHPIEVVEDNKLKEQIESEKGKEKGKEAEFDFGTACAKQHYSMDMTQYEYAMGYFSSPEKKPGRGKGKRSRNEKDSEDDWEPSPNFKNQLEKEYEQAQDLEDTVSSNSNDCGVGTSDDSEDYEWLNARVRMMKRPRHGAVAQGKNTKAKKTTGADEKTKEAGGRDRSSPVKTQRRMHD
jgi:hypothetical protein